MKKWHFVILMCLLVVFALSALAGQGTKPGAQAAPTAIAAPQHVLLPPAQMKWGPAAPGLPAGAQLAVLSGDPGKTGSFALSARFPDGYTIPPHWHPTDENVVVISGSMMLGMGDTMNESSMTTLAPGGYALLPQKMNHYAKAKGATTIIIYGMGPFEITYVNSKDDPRKKSGE